MVVRCFPFGNVANLFTIAQGKKESRSSAITNQTHYIKLIIKLIGTKRVLVSKVVDAFKLHELQMLFKNMQKQLSSFACTKN